jgi:energy-converting hydrogenase Eha subunit C
MEAAAMTAVFVSATKIRGILSRASLIESYVDAEYCFDIFACSDMDVSGTACLFRPICTRWILYLYRYHPRYPLFFVSSDMHSMDSLSVSLSPKVSIVLCFVRYALDGFFICIVITQGIHCSLFRPICTRWILYLYRYHPRYPLFFVFSDT